MPSRYIGLACAHAYTKYAANYKMTFKTGGMQLAVTRHDIRESEFIFLFEKSFRDEPVSVLIDLSWDNEAITINDEVKQTVEGVFDNLEKIDGIIESFSKKKGVGKMPKICLAALRLAVYEINYRQDVVPVGVAIDEAVGLVKKYAQDTDVSFVNGVLGAYARSIENK